MPQKSELPRLTLQNLVLEGNRLKFNLLKPFDLLLDLLKTGLWLAVADTLRTASTGYDEYKISLLKELLITA